MSDLNLNIDWDIEKGNIVVYLEHPMSGTELASLELDPETIIESFVADRDLSDVTGSDALLEDWEKLAENLQMISEVITYGLTEGRRE